MRCEFLKKDCPVEKAAWDTCDRPFPSPSDAHAARGLLGAAQSYVDVPGSTDFPRRVLGVGARNRVGRLLQQVCTEVILWHGVLSRDLARCGREAEAFVDPWSCGSEEKTRP